MGTATHNISFIRGDTYRVAFDFVEVQTQQDGTQLRVARNLSQATVAAQVRPDFDSSTAWSFSVDMTSSSTGRIILTLPAATTSLMSDGNYVWDLQMVLSGDTSTLIRGAVSVPKDVTR